MPGTPVKARMIRDITESGGYERIIERIAGGETLVKIAPEFGVSRSFLSGHLNKKFKPQMAAARKEAASVLAEQALTIADAIDPETPGSEKAAKVQIETRRWLAGRLDPEQFGEQQQGPSVQINLGDVHLSSLRDLEQSLRAKKVIDIQPVITGDQ